MPRLRRNEWNFSSNAALFITDILRQPEFQESMLGHAEPELTEVNGAKRLDLVIFKRGDSREPVVTAELKLPWTAEGRTPFNARLVENAHSKASKAGALYFITWNIRRVVVWKTDDPGVPLDKRVVYDKEIVPVILKSEADLDSTQVYESLRKGIYELLSFLNSTVSGLKEPSFLPLDRLFIAKIEAALDYPIARTIQAIQSRLDADKQFRWDVERWMRDVQGWLVSKYTETDNVERASRFSCYVLVNRLCFYNALRRKYRNLSRLIVANNIATGDALKRRLDKYFKDAKGFTGDYDTVFDGDHGDNFPFLADEAVPGWRALIRSLDEYDFAHISLDVIGAMYEQLIKPEERHRFGQHYTQPVVVDLINSFAIRKGNDEVLDPSCGGGTFLVRAYARKSYLDSYLDHTDLLESIYGCDILNYACHLSTINLAVRDLIDEENFPRIHQGDFLRYFPGGVFSKQPIRIQAGGLTIDTQEILLKPRQFDAIVGNPPYIEAKEMSAQDRDFYNQTTRQEWPNYPWKKGSDIYTYFWTHSEIFLKPGGYLALLTQAAWLDVDYGIPIQKWMLDNFRIIAILETEAEPWFTGARVATVVTILQRENEANSRNKNVVRFVQFKERLSAIIGDGANDAERLIAAEELQSRILSVDSDLDSLEYCIRLASQQELEQAGTDSVGRYIGSKWGRYLRSPETLYRVQRNRSDRFVPLRTLSNISRGITTNCDDFFIVSDVSKGTLESFPNAKQFREKFGVVRNQVESGNILIVRRGDGVELALEATHLKPILKTARDYDWFSTGQTGDYDYAVFIPEDREQLSRLAKGYVLAGEREGWHRAPSFESIHNAGGNWYTLREGHVAPILFIKTMQYTPLVLWNDANLLANQRLYTVFPCSDVDAKALCAVLNSTVFACERYAAVKALGKEAAIDVEVFSANAFRTPDFRQLPTKDIERLQDALDELCKREVSEMLEEPLLTLGHSAAKAYAERHLVGPDLWPSELKDKTRQEIDRLVLKCIGISEKEIKTIREKIYNELIAHTRKLKILELEAQINRRGSNNSLNVTPRQLADDIWAYLIASGELDAHKIPDSFIPEGIECFIQHIPVANRVVREERSLFDSGAIYAARFGRTRIEFEGIDEFTYALLLAEYGVTGDVPIPIRASDCRAITHKIKEYIENVVARFKELAAQRTSDEGLQNRIIREGMRRIVHR